MQIVYDQERCDACGLCARICPQKILRHIKKERVVVEDEARCMGCFGCEDECKTGAIRVRRAPAAGRPPEAEPRPALAAAYDVVVVGAGPAGLGAALACAAEGLAVCVVERLPGRRLSHHPDGGVLLTMPGLPAIEVDEHALRIEELGVDLPDVAGLARVERMGLIGPGGVETGSAVPDSVGPAYMGSKDRLVAALADEAERRGAVLLYDSKVVGLQRDGERFTGVVLHDGTAIGAQVVVCADGIQGKISHLAGLPNQQGAHCHATILSYEYDPIPGLPRGLYYMQGDMAYGEGMPPAMGGVGIEEQSVHVLLVLLFKKKHYKAPQPMDAYLDRFLAEDPRVRRILGDALDGRRPRMLNGCRAVFHETNHDIVRDGLVSVGDAFVAGGELGNVPALTHGVRAGRVVAAAVQAGDVSRTALAPAADFITDALTKFTEMNGHMKAMPMHVSEEDLARFFGVMKDASYPTMLFGGPYQQGWMFTKLMARHAVELITHPRLLKMLMGKV